MSNLKRGPSIDASYQVPLHLAEQFQRRRLKCEKLTDDRRRTPSDGKNSHCLWQGELKKHSDSAKKFSETDIVKMLKFLIDNIFFMFGEQVFNRQLSYTYGYKLCSSSYGLVPLYV